MKVRVAQLKAGLSGYLRELRRTGEPLEVCVRDERVAYLTAAPADATRTPDAETLDLQHRLRAVGLRWTPPPGGFSKKVTPTPLPAADGRTDISTIQEMRREKNW